MKGRRQEIGDRTKLAGGSGRRFEAIRDYGHVRTSGEEAAGRRLSGTRSGERTLPPVILSMRAATRMEAPLARKRSLRTVSAETPPIAAAMTSSVTPSQRIQSLSKATLSASLAAPTRAPASFPPDRLAEALAIIVIDMVGALGLNDRDAILEGLANTFDRRGRTRRGTEAAQMLGAVGGALMRLGC